MNTKKVKIHSETSKLTLFFIGIQIILALTSCSFPGGFSLSEATVTPELNQPIVEEVPSTNTPTTTPEPLTATTEPPTATIEPSETPITHITQPEDFTEMGAPFYDVDSSGTGLKHYAPFGDVYNLNRFERPFTQSDMTYQPYLDIQKFNLVSYGDWNYAFIKMIGHLPKNEASGSYGIEIDMDRDGFGDYLILAKEQLSTNWTTDGVSVMFDSNHTTGGIDPLLSEAPLVTDGYETIIAENGSGNDPDLAWARISPKDSSIVQIAFKIGLTEGSFMWGPVTDAGLMSPGMFNYNDQITEIDAGSPVKDSVYYPIKSLYSFDNTCRAPVGFESNGSEPLICGDSEVASKEEEEKTGGGCKVTPCPILHYFDKKSCSCKRIIIIIPFPTQVVPK